MGSGSFGGGTGLGDIWVRSEKGGVVQVKQPGGGGGKPKKNLIQKKGTCVRTRPLIIGRKTNLLETRGEP